MDFSGLITSGFGRTQLSALIRIGGLNATRRFGTISNVRGSVYNFGNRLATIDTMYLMTIVFYKVVKDDTSSAYLTTR